MKLSLTDLSPSLNFSSSRTPNSTFDHSIPSRVQYQDLMETIGVFKSQSQKNFPVTISDLKSRREKKIIPELGIPIDRKDAQLLLKWLDNMLNKITAKNENLENILESALSIYEVCFHEIVRQVSLQCKERGELINRVWKAYISLLERALRISQNTQQSQLVLFKQEKEKIKTTFNSEIIKLKCEIEEKNLESLAFSDKLMAKDDEINKLGVINKRLVHRLEIIRNHYEGVKKEIIELKEENRILKAKLVNTETEFIVNDHGVIEAQHKYLKIKKKSKANLEKFVTNDPIVNSGGVIDTSVKENLGREIVTYESELTEIFNRVDFQDSGTDAPVVELATQECNTELELTCGACETNSKEKIDPTTEVIDLIDIHLQSLLSLNDENQSLRRQSTQKHEEVNKLLQNTQYTERINLFIEKMKENIGALTAPLVHSIYHASNSTVKDTKNSESKPETKRLKTIRNKIWTVIQDSRLKKNSEISYLIIQKIKTTPQHKLKKILVKKNLLKFISVFYDTKMQKRLVDSENSKKIDMAQHVLEVLSNKYGPGKMAEGKLSQIAASCIKYKHIKRVKLFGRFLKLYEDFDSEDLETYFDLLGFLKNNSAKDFANPEYADVFLLTYEKAMELFKSNLLNKLSENDKKITKHWLESNKFVDNLFKEKVVDQDSYLECILEKNRSKKYARVNFLKCIYEAADLNDDGYLQQLEFDLLARHMASSRLVEGFTVEAFNEFAEAFTDENDVIVQALSFENFAMLSATYNVFTTESMQAFSKITNSQGAIWHIKQVTPHIDSIIKEIRWRLSKKSNWKDYENEYNQVLNVIKQKIITQKKPESVWIALRLLQEESKHICITSALRSFLPKVESLVITSANIL